MKKLSREEMKGVMGGFPQPDHWCELRCDFSGEGCGLGYAILTGPTCDEPTSYCQLGAGTVCQNTCRCYSGPVQA